MKRLAPLVLLAGCAGGTNEIRLGDDHPSWPRVTVTPAHGPLSVQTPPEFRPTQLGMLSDGKRTLELSAVRLPDGTTRDEFCRAAFELSKRADPGRTAAKPEEIPFNGGTARLDRYRPGPPAKVGPPKTTVTLLTHQAEGWLWTASLSPTEPDDEKLLADVLGTVRTKRL